MKNLATCTPREFMIQTNLIRRSVENWLKVTEIMEIRKRVPKLPEVPELPENVNPAEKADILAKQAEILKKRNEIMSQAAMDNAFAIVEAAFDKHPDETLEVLALVCFVPVAEVNDHPVKYYMQSIRELIQDEEVVSFFTSLLRLARTTGT